MALCAALFAVLFSALVLVENAFVRHQVMQNVTSDLRETVDEVVRALEDTGHWSLSHYRQADVQATQYIVVTGDGTLVDVQGFVPGVITRGAPPLGVISGRPVTVRTSAGETWLVQSKRVAGGTVIAGMVGTQFLKDPGALLAAELTKFGSTLGEAVRVKPRDISNFIDGYAVLDDLGEVRYAVGGVPLKVAVNLPPQVADETPWPVPLRGKMYALWRRHIPAGAGAPAGVIVAFDDVSDLSSVLALYWRFNGVVALTAWAVVVLGTAAWLLSAEMRRRRQEVSLEDALRAGEGPTIEFKAGFIDQSLARTMAAFANTDSGNIFLGVNDNAEVVGLDDAETPKDRDRWQQKVGGLARDVVRPPLLVSPKFFEYDGKVVLRVFVPRGPAVAYMVENVPYIRDLTSVRRAGPDDLPAILRSHRKYWG